MRLTSFAVKGFLAYQASEARVNAADLPTGVIAVVGPNGHGKSTLLETALATLFRLFPSRNDKDVVDYAFTSDAYLEVAFDLDGRGHFRARLNVDGPRRKSAGSLEFVSADGTRTFLNSDGKVTSYDAAIRQLLPPPELFLASVFASQNLTGSFVRLEKAERKKLFAALLGLGHLEQMAERAKQAAGLVQQTLIPLRSARDVLARDASDAVGDELAALANQLQHEAGAIELRRQELQDDLTAIQRELDALQAEAAAHAAAQTQADALALDLRAAELDHQTALAALDRLASEDASERAALDAAAADAIAAIDRQAADRSTVDRELRRIDAALASALVDPTTRLKKNQHLLDTSADIQQAVAAIAAAEREITRLRADEQRLGAELDVARARERVLATALSDIAQRETQLARARADVEIERTVPCGGAGEYAACRFLANVAEAKAQIPGLEEACRSRTAAEQERAAVLAAIDTATRTLTATRQAIADQERSIADHRPKAENAPHLALAQERIAGYEARIQELQADAARARAAAEARETERVADLRTRRADREQQRQADLAALAQRTTTRRKELSERADRLAQMITEKRFTLDELHQQLTVSQDAADRAAAQRALLQLRQREWDESTGALAAVGSRREDLERRRTAYARRREEWLAANARIATLERDLAEWQVLAKACARDGLQTIEIDNAGPTVSAYTNDILRACYGPRFSVEIVTQEEKRTTGKDGSTHKETFELKVYDSERGGPARDISDLSGGEKVIVDEALKSAIALLVNTRNQFPIRTCWRDETTGPLDEDNRARYLTMLRRVHELGGFAHTFFVTHDEDTALQADAQLVVYDGTVTVALPPYRRNAVAA